MHIVKTTGAAAAAAALFLPFAALPAHAAPQDSLGSTDSVSQTADAAQDTAGTGAKADAPESSAKADADAVGSVTAGTKVQLLNFTDFHGRIGDGTGAAMASTIEKARNDNSSIPTALLSSGDNIGASTYASSSQDDNPTLDYLNALGVQSSAAGNHEFDRGYADLKDRVDERADFPTLAANVYKKGTTTVADGLKPYSIITVGTVKVGVIGVVTKETASLVSPSGISGLDFGDPVTAVNKAAEDIKDKVDLTVLTAHAGPSATGSLDEAEASGAEFKSLVTKGDSSIDAMFFGHTHLPMNLTQKNGTTKRPIMQAAKYGEEVAQAILTSDGAGNWSIDKQQLLETKPKQPAGPPYVNDTVKAAEKIIAEAEAKAKEIGSKVVGTITSDITRAGNATGGEDRGAESTLGNLVADALKDGTSDSQLAPADLGITNPGGLRADLKKDAQFLNEKPGEVTVGELNAVLPFANDHGVVTLKGKDLIQVFAEQSQPAGSARPFLHLGVSKNVRVVYESAEVTKDNAGGTPKKVLTVTVDGKEVDPDKDYRVATLSFLASGGDNFTFFAKGTFEQSGLTDFDVWQSYFTKNAPVSPDTRERQADAKNDLVNTGDLTWSVKNDAQGSQDFTLTIDAKKAVSGPLTFAVKAPTGYRAAFADGVTATDNAATLTDLQAGTTTVKFSLETSAARARAAAASTDDAAAQDDALDVSLTSDRSHAWWDNDPLPLVHTQSVAYTAPSESPEPTEEPSDTNTSQGPGADEDQGQGEGQSPDSENQGQSPQDDGQAPGSDDTSSERRDDSLPRTGSEVAGLIGAGALLLLIGGATVAMTRTRTRD